MERSDRQIDGSVYELPQDADGGGDRGGGGRGLCGSLLLQPTRDLSHYLAETWLI
ncbi:MAG: hypothetical protein MUC51_09650 [Anaerolineae bacterium]|nr:hypothetical protein [Anaerolineae bacterium]